jgi:hypothetical protein
LHFKFRISWISFILFFWIIFWLFNNFFFELILCCQSVQISLWIFLRLITLAIKILKLKILLTQLFLIFKFIIGISFKFEFLINLFIYLLFILFIIFVWIHLTINNFLIVEWLQTRKPLVFYNLEFWGSLEINIFFLLMILKEQTFFWV